MRKLVVLPSDPMQAYLDKGQSYEYYEEYFNPGGFFDEVYALSPWGKTEKIGKVHYIQAKPRKFRSIIKKIRPDAVRAYGGYYCTDWATVNRVQDIPIIVSVHDTNPQLIYPSIKYADMVICMSKAVKDAVQELVGVAEDRICIMPNRIDTNTFSYKCDEKLCEELNVKYGRGKHILHVGRKQEQKNIDTVIRALALLPDEYTTLFVGQGDTTPYLNLAKELGVEDRCYFVPSISRNDLPYYYSWCDCMCTPSRWEGFGMVFAEAAACESAIVTSNIGPMNEFLKDGENAILVDEYENSQEIAKAIIKACENTEEIQKMKKAARLVGLQFEKSKIDQQEMDIYQKVLERGSNNYFVHDWKLRKKVFFHR